MTVTKAKEILLKRIKAEENMIDPPYGVSGVYALRKAAVVLDDVEKGKLVERKNGKWIYNNLNGMVTGNNWICSECGNGAVYQDQFLLSLRC